MSKCNHNFVQTVERTMHTNWQCVHCGIFKDKVDEAKVHTAVFSINVEYKIEADNSLEAEAIAKEMMISAELPDNYVHDSVEFLRIE
jgi:hypothetical protein